MTTIAVDDTTRQRLAILKEEWQAESLDEVIRRLLDDARPVPKSLRGVDRGRIPMLTRAVRDDLLSERPARSKRK